MMTINRRVLGDYSFALLSRTVSLDLQSTFQFQLKYGRFNVSEHFYDKPAHGVPVNFNERFGFFGTSRPDGTNSYPLQLKFGHI